MADQKITELTEKTTLENDDLIPIVDIAANPDETKKVKVQNLITIPNLASHKSRHDVGGDDELDVMDLFLLLMNPYYFNDWRNLDGITQGATGSGSYGSVPAEIMSVNTGETSGSEAYVYGQYLYQSKFRFKTYGYFSPSEMTNCTVWLGFLSAPTAPTTTSKHIAFKILNGTLYASCGNGSSNTVEDCGAYSGGRILSFKATATEAKFYLDGTLVATITTNLPSADSHYPTLYIVNSAVADRGFRIQPWYYTAG